MDLPSKPNAAPDLFLPELFSQTPTYPETGSTEPDRTAHQQV